MSPSNKAALPSADRPPPLTYRELQVLEWVMRGRSDWQIGAILMISAKTVNYHVERAKHKLNTSSRTQAAVTALQLGLITPPPPAGL